MPPDATGESDSHLGLAWDILARALGFGYRSSGPWRPAGRSSNTARPQTPRPGQPIARTIARCHHQLHVGPPREITLCWTPLVHGQCALHGTHTEGD